jgi:protein subunit release factor A
MALNPEEFRVDIACSRGRDDSYFMRITHLPTGISVQFDGHLLESQIVLRSRLLAELEKRVIAAKAVDASATREPDGH